MRNRLIIKVAVAAPLFTLFDYLPAQQGTSLPQPGCRVLVPFGSNSRIGVVWQHCELDPQSPPRHQLKAVSRVIDQTPLLDELELRFLQWCADYYHHPPGDVVCAALPARLRRAVEPRPTAERGWMVVDKPPALSNFDRAPLQQQIVRLLLQAGGCVAESSLRMLQGDVRSAIKRLAEKGVIQGCAVAARPPHSANPASLTLTDEQQQAVKAIDSAAGFSTLLLDGITGSGKTEVYLRAAGKVVAQGGQVLVLVPEIALTPQLLRRFQQGIDGHVVVSHSALNNSDRERAWMLAQQGDADLLVGTRSAIFTPMPRLALIVVDEEHDSSYKQQEGFRYSARDLAVVKAKLRQIPVVLGSATPSLESLYNCLRHRYQWLKLRQRAGEAMLPQIGLIDIRAQRLRAGIASDLLKSMREEIDQGRQVMLFLNRRGYAPQLTCHACGWIAECRHCDARMTWHQQLQRLWCHHCGAQLRKPHSCPDCNAKKSLIHQGQGTERVEEYLGELFAGTPVIRVDRDSTRRKGSLQQILERVQESGSGILIGTQMLAKGHHFPNVTLVGILNADQGLLNPDFRAPERTAQLLLQVAGRAGRAAKAGRVLIQTRHPHNPLLQRLLQEDYEAFSREELQQRRDAQLPPFAHQALLRAEGSDSQRVKGFMQFAMSQSRVLLPGIELWGPAPALMERKAGVFRWHLLLQADSRAELQRHLAGWLQWLRQQPQARRIKWTLDIDPVEIL
jgi:primosomal protein N' (replication factor Y) (superfamily II helicase)